MNIETMTESLYRIPIPVPFPMKYIYCYLAKGKQGVVLVDVGLNDQAAQEAWKEAFDQLQVQPDEIKAIYLTHFHPDHYGMAGWLQELTGANVYISETDLAMVERVWRSGQTQAIRIGNMGRQHGVPHELAEQIVEHMLKLNKLVNPQPELQPLMANEVWLGDECWEVFATPGHSDGHVCFYQPQRKMLLSGDHLLDKITPNISLWPGGRPNPLQDYYQSLQKTAELDAVLALPSHGKLIEDIRQRVNEMMVHHEQRLERVFTLAKHGRTAYEVALELFGHKDLTPHQWRFAMAETLAHLEYLSYEKKLVKREGEPIVYAASEII